MPVRFAADDPASDALVAASLPSASGISRLPQVEGEASPKRKFKAYPIGYFHIDIAEVRTAQGKLHLIAAIDRTSKFAFVELHERVARRTAADFLRHLIEAVPYKVQVERMNRTIKDATVKRYFYETHNQLRAHLRDFVDAYNFARRLNTLRGLTPYEFVCKAWTSQPQRFTISPLQKMPGLNARAPKRVGDRRPVARDLRVQAIALPLTGASSPSQGAQALPHPSPARPCTEWSRSRGGAERCQTCSGGLKGGRFARSVTALVGSRNAAWRAGTPLNARALEVEAFRIR